jgi:lipopolysaccharide export LptBFGC system permease protein LptF
MDHVALEQFSLRRNRINDMIFKIIIVGMLVFMIFNLFKALFTMNKNDPNKPPMSRYIGRRVMTSVAIILILVVGILTGLITPNPRPF